MSPTADDPAEGEQIGPFRVGRRIGGGGMGVVVEAVDLGLGRRVALKVISGHLAADEVFRRRFTAEARALAALDSEHVVRVHAHGEHAGRLYLATELIPDGDLAHLIRAAGPPPLRVALDLCSQVAAGLAAAHAAGVVHRDVKPANVLLRRRDGAHVACLCDFGVAGRLGPHQACAETGASGTPAWMAPELHAGGAAGVASDIYALGCVLWATVSGRPPYAAATERALAAAHREQPIPQLRGHGRIAHEVNRILRRAMAKDPTARHRSAIRLRDDLQRAASLPERPSAAVSLAAAVLVAAATGPAAPPVGGTGAAPAAAPAAAPSVADEARAGASLARALAERAVMNRAQARCTAGEWIERAGLRPMVRAGFFDADLRYRDRGRSAMTPRIKVAASAAARACAAAP